MIEVPMPRLSDSMEQGTIVRWIAKDREPVQRGDPLAEIETDKASVVYEADHGGVLERVASEGDTLPVGALIAHLLEEGEQAPSDAAPREHAPREPEPRDGREPPEPEPRDGRETPAVEAQEHEEQEQARGDGGARRRSSPLARRLASEAGIALSQIQGSGPGGRIVKADVQQAMQRAQEDEGGRVAPRPSPIKGEAETVQLTRTQELIARRMAEAKATIPEFTLQSEVDMEAAVAVRDQLKVIAQERATAAPSFNDLIVKACALALRRHPKANGTYRDGAFHLHSAVNIGIAVATAEALLVPVIRDADRLSIWEIASESRRLAGAVRDRSITPPQLSGGTFSVSNLGMYGVEAFTAVINPPQAAILAVGAVSQRAVVHDGELAARHGMTVTLSCDHRILYGADAAEFLGFIKDLLAQPLRLLV